MTDRETVINVLNTAIDTAFAANYELAKVPINIAIHAVDMLKAQEPVTPIYKSDMQFCGACRYAIPNTINYCPRCGRKVNWDDSN